MTDDAENVQMVPKCEPPGDAEWWSHHWIGPENGDQEPWLWTDGDRWVRGMQQETPETMAARGWVYGGACERPEVVADLRRRLASAEAGHGVVVPFTPHRSHPMTDTPPMVELKPCPFCGGEAEIDSDRGVTGQQYFAACASLDCPGNACLPFTTYARRAEAITAWNTRAPSEVERELVGALKVAHEFITNGIELGYIRMPSPGTPDRALDTPEIVRAAIARATGASP